MKTKSWEEIKNNVYGKKGSLRRDELEREFETFKIGLLLREARKKRNLTQQELGEKINNVSSINLYSQYQIIMT